MLLMRMCGYAMDGGIDDRHAKGNKTPDVHVEDASQNGGIPTRSLPCDRITTVCETSGINAEEKYSTHKGTSLEGRDSWQWSSRKVPPRTTVGLRCVSGTHRQTSQKSVDPLERVQSGRHERELVATTTYSIAAMARRDGGKLGGHKGKAEAFQSSIGCKSKSVH